MDGVWEYMRMTGCVPLVPINSHDSRTLPITASSPTTTNKQTINKQKIKKQVRKETSKWTTLYSQSALDKQPFRVKVINFGTHHFFVTYYFFVYPFLKASFCDSNNNATKICDPTFPRTFRKSSQIWTLGWKRKIKFIIHPQEQITFVSWIPFISKVFCIYRKVKINLKIWMHFIFISKTISEISRFSLKLKNGKTFRKEKCFLEEFYRFTQTFTTFSIQEKVHFLPFLQSLLPQIADLSSKGL